MVIRNGGESRNALGIQLYMDRVCKPNHARLKRMPIPVYEQTGNAPSINRRSGSRAWRGRRDITALASPGPAASCYPPSAH